MLFVFFKVFKVHVVLQEISPSLSSAILEQEHSHISFKQLYDTIQSNLDTNGTLALLFVLLSKNPDFRIYHLSRTDPESMLSALLQALQSAIDSSDSFSISLLLAILFLLSNDKMYNSCIQQIVMKVPGWYSDKSIRSISLGGLQSLLLFRVIQLNVSTLHVKHIHTLVLAIMMNTATSILDMESIVCKRLVSLLDQSVKKYSKLLESTETIWLYIYSDIIATILEIINTVIFASIKTNSNLIYNILQIDFWSDLKEYTRFRDLVTNIEMVLLC
jgi:hypothetical protein